jgi:hypothetical protein
MTELIRGDKKYILPLSLSEFAGKTNLIDIDPPFKVAASSSPSRPPIIKPLFICRNLAIIFSLTSMNNQTVGLYYRF